MARHAVTKPLQHEGFVSGAGARIYFKTLGKGFPLLLLHGGPGADHSDFLPYLRALGPKLSSRPR